MSDFRVVICGGGVAGVEGLLRLRRLLGDEVEVKLVTPDEDLVLRPVAVREPFAWGEPTRYGLNGIATEHHAELVRDGLERVDVDAQTVHTIDGQALEYDALLIAVGGRQVPAFEHVTTFRDAEADATFHGVVQDIEEGYTRTVAFMLPDGPVWPLPIYELALMTAERAGGMGAEGVGLTLVTPESSPLAIFGGEASEAVAGLLDRAGITVFTSAVAHPTGSRQLLVQPQGVELEPERMIAMPRVEGPAIRGLPHSGGQGFIPIDAHCRVPGTNGRVFAAGDAAAYPVKHGGLGAQMADTAAGVIAELAGRDGTAAPFTPTIRGMLLTGSKPLYFSARVAGGHGFHSEVYEEPPWPADEKIVADELGPYLAERHPQPPARG